MPIAGLVKVGLGKETVWGTAVSPTTLFPVTARQFSEPTGQIVDNYVRGIRAMDYAAYQGVRHPEYTMEGPFYIEECGHLLAAILGTASDYTVTDLGGGRYSHPLTLGNAQRSYTIRVDQPDDTSLRQTGTGMVIGQLQLNINAMEGLMTYSANFSGKQLTVGTSGDGGVGAIGADATGFGGVSGPFEGWRADVTIGGGNFDNLISAEISLQNELDIKFTANNTQAPAAILTNRLEVTARLSVHYTNVSQLDYFRNKTQNAVSIVLAKTINSLTKSLTITMSAFDYGDAPAEIDMGGIGQVLNLSGRALYNATDAGMIKFTLVNERASNY